MAYVSKASFLVLCVQLAQAARVQDADANHAEMETEAFMEKSESAAEVTIHISFNESVSSHGNLVGNLNVYFPSGGHLTNQGFARGYPQRPPAQWSPGAILGKSDDDVWPIMPSGNGFAFDHGASDLIFGDVDNAGTLYTPEFEEVAFNSNNRAKFHVMAVQSPEQARQKLLMEERKESVLTFSQWNPLGFVQKAHRPAKMQYDPKLKLKDGSQGFQGVSKVSEFSKVTMVRPSILDVDYLFDDKSPMPSSFRSSHDVNMDPGYGAYGFPGQPGYAQPGLPQQGYHPQPGRPQQHGYPQPGQPQQHGYPQPGQPQQHGYPQPGQPQQHGYPQPGLPGQPGYPQPGFNQGYGTQVNSRCYAKQSFKASLQSLAGKFCQGQCTTRSECDRLGGRFKNKYCTGRSDCGCCKEIGWHRGHGSLLEVRSLSNSSAVTESPELAVQMSVQWLIPVLQKYRCVTVSPEAAKLGRGALFIAMGWDTDSVQGSFLDLDVSLVPLDKAKNVISQKMVWYQQQKPRALGCGHTFAMQAFVDDQNGEGSGDDELIKMDFNCLNAYHHDIDAIVVMVNIFKPPTVAWENIDSAYLRIITGGQERRAAGNFFIEHADAVRSFVRLSGDDLKRDPEMRHPGLAVGMFFRQPSGTWAFGTMMRGVPGRNVQESAPHISHMMRDLVYPANEQWDQTMEHKEAVKTGAFGEAGLLTKGALPSLLRGGQLPCIATREDHALLMMGHMNKQGLEQVIQNPHIPQKVKETALGIKDNSKKADQIRQLTVTVDKMEQAHTKEERKAIAVNVPQQPIAPPTEQESNQAASDIDDLFSDI